MIVSMKYVCRRLLQYVVLMTAVSGVSLAGDVPGNMAIINEVADIVIQKLIREHLPQSDTIVVKGINQPGETKWYFESRFIHALQEHGVVVKTVDATRTDIGVNKTNPIQVEYQIQRLGVSYSDMGRSIFHPRLVRTATAHIYGRIIRWPEGMVIWSGEIFHTNTDTIRYKDVKKVERTVLKLGRSDVPSRFGWRELADALLITGATGAVIYTFYSYRSR